MSNNVQKNCKIGREEHPSDMEFVQKFTPPDFQAKNFTPSISPNFNSFSGKKHKKWVKMEKFTPLAKILHCRRHWRHGQIPPLSKDPREQNKLNLRCLSNLAPSPDILFIWNMLSQGSCRQGWKQTERISRIEVWKISKSHNILYLGNLVLHYSCPQGQLSVQEQDWIRHYAKG